MRQQSKLEWINGGDHCTKLFFAKMKQRKQASYIFCINDETGNRVDGFQAVADVMIEFYQKLLGEQNTNHTHVSQKIMEAGPILNTEQQLTLCSAITNEEIKEVIFSIPNEKSPGPDGYSSGLFKATWGELGPLVCQAIQEFFTTGKLLKECNLTNLVVLPKSPHPMNATDFRPISCCTVIYKSVSKIMCNRLNNVLPYIISPSQGAFVQGRELLYNVLLSQELARGYNRQHISPRCLMKIDLRRLMTQFNGISLRK